MKPFVPPPNPNAQRGFLTVIVMAFLASVVLFILAKSLSMSGTKSLESQEHFDSVAALALADSGLEAGLASLSHAVNLDDTAFTSSCASLASSSAIPLGRGSFQYIPSSTASSSSDCPIRVKGSVNSASRTLESQINFKVQIGDGNFGQSPSLTLKNPYSVPAVAIFNLAWGLKRSSGHATTGNGTTATPNCTGCIARWNLASAGGGNNSVGSMGTSIPVAANSTATFAETLSDARNYVQVGLIMGGIAGSPTYINSFSDNKETGNTSNNLTTTGNIPTGEPSSGGGWCNGADTLILGLSGVGPYQASPPPPAYDYTAAMTSVTFNTNSGADVAIPLTWASHYPNTDGTSPNTTGDVYSEIWWTYNPYIKMTGASSAGTTVTVASTANLKTGTLLKVYSGSGAFAANTRVSSVLSPTQFTVNQTPTTALSSGAVICGGICALFHTPATNGATTTLTISRTGSAATAQQYVGGMACFSGVDPTKVKRVSSSGLNLRLWHEILSTDP